MGYVKISDLSFLDWTVLYFSRSTRLMVLRVVIRLVEGPFLNLLRCRKMGGPFTSLLYRINHDTPPFSVPRVQTTRDHVSSAHTNHPEFSACLQQVLPEEKSIIHQRPPLLLLSTSLSPLDLSEILEPFT